MARREEGELMILTGRRARGWQGKTNKEKRKQQFQLLTSALANNLYIRGGASEGAAVFSMH